MNSVPDRPFQAMPAAPNPQANACYPVRDGKPLVTDQLPAWPGDTGANSFATAPHSGAK